MPHEASVQPEASTVSTGLSIRYIRDYAYAYSGAVGVITETSLIESTSGSGFIVAKILFGYGTYGDADFAYRIYLNNIKIFSQRTDNASTPFAANITAPVIIIPPRTHVKLTAHNVSSGDEEDQLAILTGRVYGAE